CGGRHDLPRLAIAALHDLEIEPGLLHFAANRRLADTFDRGDRAFADRADGQEAGSHCDTVDVNGASAALRDTATEFRSGQTEEIPQGPQQGRVIGRIDRSRNAIDLQCDHEWRLL